MKKLTKEEFLKLKEELKELHKSDIDYSKFRISKVKRRYIMIRHADDIAYRKKNKRLREIHLLFKDEMDDLIRRRQYIVNENGQIIFTGYAPKNKERND